MISKPFLYHRRETHVLVILSTAKARLNIAMRHTGFCTFWVWIMHQPPREDRIRLGGICGSREMSKDYTATQMMEGSILHATKCHHVKVCCWFVDRKKKGLLDWTHALSPGNSLNSDQCMDSSSAVKCLHQIGAPPPTKWPWLSSYKPTKTCLWAMRSSDVQGKISIQSNQEGERPPAAKQRLQSLHLAERDLQENLLTKPLFLLRTRCKHVFDFSSLRSQIT